MLNDFYSKLSEQEKKIFYVALVIVMLMVLDRMFLGPSLSKMKAYDDEIEQQRVNIQRDLRFITYKDQIVAEDHALRPYYRNDYKTEEQIIAAFLKKVEMMATDAKVNLIKITPAESKERKGFTEYYADLECEGLLENIASFMHAIDTSDDLLKIVKVSFSLKRVSGDEVVVGMEVSKMLMGSRLNSQADESSGSGGGSSKSGPNDTAATEPSGSSGGGSSGPSGQPDGAAGEGSGSGGNQGDQDRTLKTTPSSGSGDDEKISERYQMKGKLFDEKNQKKLEQAIEKEPPLKKSVYEKIVERVGSQPGQANNENE